MIQVQIAGRLGRHGVQGVRWVLVEAGDPAARAAAPAAALAEAATSAAEAPGQSPRAVATLWLLKAGVLLLGLGLAWWTALAVLGPPPPRPRLPGVPPAGQPVPAVNPASGASAPARPLVTAQVQR